MSRRSYSLAVGGTIDEPAALRRGALLPYHRATCMNVREAR